MAKFKMRKLIKQVEMLGGQNQILNGRLNDTMAMLALVAHREGGTLAFTQEDFKGLPEAAFSVKKEENGGISLTLTYQEDPVIPETAPIEQ